MSGRVDAGVDSPVRRSPFSTGRRRVRPHRSHRSTRMSAARVTAASYSTPQNEQRTRMPRLCPEPAAAAGGRPTADRRSALARGARDVVELAGRLPVEQPRFPDLGDESLVGELLQRGGHRGPPGGDEVGDQLVREAQGDADALRGHTTPAVGQVPHEHQDPAVDARIVRDRHVDDERARPLHGSADERSPDLWVGGGACRKALVEQREDRLVDHAEAGVERQRHVLAVVLPRTHEIAGSEQLGAVAARPPDATHDEAVQEEQADAAAHRLADLFGIPRALERHERRGDQIALGAPEPLAFETGPEIRITDQYGGQVPGHDAIVLRGGGRPARARAGAEVRTGTPVSEPRRPAYAWASRPCSWEQKGSGTRLETEHDDAAFTPGGVRAPGLARHRPARRRACAVRAPP